MPAKLAVADRRVGVERTLAQPCVAKNIEASLLGRGGHALRQVGEG
jgi:hypothetical protein